MADLKHGVLTWKKRGDVYVSEVYKITCDQSLRYPFRLHGAHGMLLYGSKFEPMLEFASVHYQAQIKAAPNA